MYVFEVEHVKNGVCPQVVDVKNVTPLCAQIVNSVFWCQSLLCTHKSVKPLREAREVLSLFMASDWGGRARGM